MSAKETLVSTLTNALSVSRVGRLDAHRKEAERLVDEALKEEAQEVVPEQDTLAEWLYWRYSKSQLFEDRDWSKLSEDDKAFWEHEATAVRRAVSRGGFKKESE